MIVLKNKEFTKIYNESPAHLIISNSTQDEEFVQYDENTKTDYQIFVLEDELHIVSKIATPTPLTIHINKKNIDFLMTSTKSHVTLKNDVVIKQLVMKNESLVTSDMPSSSAQINKIEMSQFSNLKIAKINQLEEITSSDASAIQIKKIDTHSLRINHSSDSFFEIESGNIHSLVAENKSKASHLRVNANVVHADLLNHYSGLITSTHIQNSLTALLQSYGGIDAGGKCEEFIHIHNNGNNRIRLNNLDTERFHFISHLESNIYARGTAKHLFFQSAAQTIASLKELNVNDATIVLNHHSQLEVRVKDSLDAKLENSSFLQVFSDQPLDSQLIESNTNSHSEIIVASAENSPILSKSVLSDDIKTFKPASPSEISSSIGSIRSRINNLQEKSFAFLKKL